MRCTASLRWSLLGLALGMVCATAADAAERTSLARLVPADAGLCVEIHELAATVTALRQGPIAARWRQVPELGALLGLLEREVEKHHTALRGQLGISPEESAVLFGTDLAIAVWPPKTRDGQGSGALLLACDDPKLLARIESHIVGQQRKAGKLGKERKLTVGEREVVVNAIGGSDGAPTQLAVVDGFAVLSTNQAALDQIVAGLSLRAIAQPLAGLAAYQTGIERLDPSAPIRVFLNPRVWDQAMQGSAVPQAKRTRFIRDGILGVWEASDYFVASATLAPDIQIEAFLACEQSRLPEPFRTMAASATGQVALIEHMPADSLAIVAARLNAGQMLRALVDADTVAKYWSQLPKSLGWAGSMALLGGLGPNATVALVPADGDRNADMDSPLNLLAAVTTQPVEDDANGKPLGLEFLPLMRETFRWMAKAAKANPSPEAKPGIRVEALEQSGREVFGVAGIIRDRPDATIYVAEDHDASNSHGLVWFGGSASRVAESATGKPKSLKQGWQALHDARIGEPSDLVYVDVARLRQTLADSPEGSGKLLAGPRSEADVGERKLKDLLSRLQAADALLGEVRLDAAGLGASLRIHCD